MHMIFDLVLILTIVVILWVWRQREVRAARFRNLTIRLRELKESLARAPGEIAQIENALEAKKKELREYNARPRTWKDYEAGLWSHKRFIARTRHSFFDNSYLEAELFWERVMRAKANGMSSVAEIVEEVDSGTAGEEIERRVKWLEFQLSSKRQDVANMPEEIKKIEELLGQQEP